MGKALWTAEQNALFWQGISDGLCNKEIAALTGKTRVQVKHKREHQINKFARERKSGPNFLDCEPTLTELQEINWRAVELMREHHPERECW
jgi:hypothetical protein